MKRSALALVVILAAMAGACAPKTAPPSTVAGLRYPDFVFPAPPSRVGDARLRAKLDEGWSRLQAGDVKGAESALGLLARQQPAYYPAAVGLGYALIAQGRPKEALARFDAAAAQAPRYGPALAGRGEALLAGGQRDAALEAFEAALAADPKLNDLGRRIDALKLDQFQDRVAAAKRAADAGRFDDARDALRGGDCALAGHGVPLPRPGQRRDAPEEPPRGGARVAQGGRARPRRRQGVHGPRRACSRTAATLTAPSRRSSGPTPSTRPMP